MMRGRFYNEGENLKNIIKLLLIGVLWIGFTEAKILTVLEKEKIEQASEFDSRGMDLYYTGYYKKSISLFLKSLSIKEKILSKYNSDIDESYNNLAVSYFVLSDYLKALSYYKKSLVIKEKLFGTNNFTTASTYDSLGGIYQRIGNYSEALDYTKKSLAILEEFLGKKHFSLAIHYYDIGFIYQQMDNYSKAINYYKKSLSIYENRDKEHKGNIFSYNKLGVIYSKIGDYPKALNYHKKDLAIQEKFLGKKHSDVAIIYENIGITYENMGNYSKAMSYYKMSLGINKKALILEYPTISKNYEQIAFIYEHIGDYTNALSYYKKSLAIKEKALGKKNQIVNASYDNLGILYQRVGNNSQALKYYKKSLALKNIYLGPRHPRTAKTYNSIGSLYASMGDYPKALKYIQKALVIKEKWLDSEHIDTAISYSTLGSLYQSMGDYPKALKYFQKTLSINEKTLGEKHLSTAIDYGSLGLTYVLMDNDDKGLSYRKKSLFIMEKILNKGHPEIGIGYYNLSFIHFKKGNYRKALKYGNKSLDITKKALGKEHLSTSLVYNILGELYNQLENYPKAHLYAKKSFNIFIINRDKNFPILNDAQKRAYLKKNQHVLPLLLSSAYLNKESNSTREKSLEINQETLNAWLRYKGSILSSANAITTLYNNTKDKKLKATIDEMRATTRLYAKLQGSPESKDPEGYKKRLAEYSNKIDTLTNAIADKAQSFKQVQELNKITYKDVAATLGKEDIYIDYAKAGEYYYVFTLDSKEHITFTQIDSNKSKEIDTLVQTFRDEVGSILEKLNSSRTKKDMKAFYDFTANLQKSNKQTLSTLYTLLIKEPLSTQIKNKQTLIFSPGGALRLLPFETLYNKKSKQYLLESKQIHYIPSGKERVRLYRYNKGTKNKTKKVTVFNNPDYDRIVPKTLKAQWKQEKKQNKDLALSRGGYAFKSLSHYFNPLKGSEVEAKMLKEYYPSTVKEYNQTQASEKKLFSLEEIPKVLHLSTHGFFLNDTNIINPMLKSGIVLAGANVSRRFYKDRGIITALKLSGLNLKGTDLVVLSACETAVVDSNSTEAVSGLSKAFLQAGAKGVLSTLWSVADKESAELMSDFYKESKNHKSYADSLQSAKLNMIHQNLHPFFWAGFVLLGE